MTRYNSAILEAAGEHLGLTEWPGAKDNPAILAFFEATGNAWVKDDETAWCAAFVGAVLAQVGIQGTGKLNARSYLEWGEKVSMKDAAPGDVVVFWRGDPKGWQGHVAFLVRFDGDKVIVRGGNQGNKVSDAAYPVSRILGIRRYTGQADASTGRPLIKSGSKGAFVLDLQDQLGRLRYFIGKKDGDFGPATRAAVQAFQADNGLTVDGIVGAKTWAALEVAEPKPLRDHDEASLREAGSRTIATADVGETRARQAGAAILAGAGLDTALETLDKVQGASSTLAAAQAVLLDNWIIIAVGLIGVALWLKGPEIFGRIKALRVADAITGRNLGR